MFMQFYILMNAIVSKKNCFEQKFISFIEYYSKRSLYFECFISTLFYTLYAFPRFLKP